MCITLFAVEQRSKGASRQRGAAEGGFHHKLPIKRQVTFERLEQRMSHPAYNFGAIGYMMASSAITLQSRGENEDDVFKMQVPSNAPYQEGRFPAREAGAVVWFLSLAMFRLRDRAYVQRSGRTEDQA